MNNAEFEDLAKLLQPYYTAGLVWETRAEMLYVHWGKTRCIGSVSDVLRLSGAQMDTLLSVWFAGHKEWAMSREENKR